MPSFRNKNTFFPLCVCVCVCWGVFYRESRGSGREYGVGGSQRTKKIGHCNTICRSRAFLIPPLRRGGISINTSIGNLFRGLGGGIRMEFFFFYPHLPHLSRVGVRRELDREFFFFILFNFHPHPLSSLSRGGGLGIDCDFIFSLSSFSLREREREREGQRDQAP